MQFELVFKIAIALLPALLMLIVCDRFEAFNLVRFRKIVAMLLIGGALAVIAYFANGALIGALALDFADYSRFVAPLVEETAKASPIIILYAANRIGFKIDAAIIGFAIGTGFSIIENGYQLYLFADASVGVWLVRGLGTAVMHGGATALFAVITHELTDEQAVARAADYRLNMLYFIPGLIAAAAIHAGFNLFDERPLLLMVVAFTVVPLALFAVLSIGEAAARNWILSDNRVHEQILADIETGTFAGSEAGLALCAVADRFGPDLRDEVFDYLKIHTELVLRAERLLLARGEPGDCAEPGAEDRALFDRLNALEARLGKAALRALHPLLHFSRNDLWEMHLLACSVPDEGRS